jgi:hypothetical protein
MELRESRTNRQDNEYYLFGARPVKWVAIEGHPAQQVLKYDWDTGFFILGTDYVHRILFDKHEIEELAEPAFIVATETLRRTTFRGDNAVFALYALVEEILAKAVREGRPVSDEEQAMMFLIYKQTYERFEEVSIPSKNYWKKSP